MKTLNICQWKSNEPLLSELIPRSVFLSDESWIINYWGSDQTLLKKVILNSYIIFQSQLSVDRRKSNKAHFKIVKLI